MNEEQDWSDRHPHLFGCIGGLLATLLTSAFFFTIFIIGREIVLRLGWLGLGLISGFIALWCFFFLIFHPKNNRFD